MNGTLTAARTLHDYARLTQEHLTSSLWNFITGEDRTFLTNRVVLDQARLRPETLLYARSRDTRILGRVWPVPLAVAPLAYQALAHPDGELATVRAAGETGIATIVSAFAARTLEQLAAAAGAPLWLQTYCFRDRAMAHRLVRRAEDAGFEALVLAVDAPHSESWLLGDHPLPHGITPVNLDPAAVRLDPSFSWSTLAWLRSITSLPVLVTGVLTAQVARAAAAAGVDGIVISNRGAVNLSPLSATLTALPEVVSAVGGRCPVLLDGGIRHGTDVLAALALGADAVLLGRPVVYGLAVGGQDGVADVLDIIVYELNHPRRAADAARPGGRGARRPA